MTISDELKQKYLATVAELAHVRELCALKDESAKRLRLENTRLRAELDAHPNRAESQSRTASEIRSEFLAALDRLTDAELIAVSSAVVAKLIRLFQELEAKLPCDS